MWASKQGRSVIVQTLARAKADLDLPGKVIFISCGIISERLAMNIDVHIVVIEWIYGGYVRLCGRSYIHRTSPFRGRGGLERAE